MANSRNVSRKYNGFKSQINLNVTIHNDNSINTTNNIVQNEDNGEIEYFIEYIIEERPDWYTPNKWILISTLYDKFIDVCNSSTSKQRFSINSNNKLFSKKGQKVIDGKKGRAVLLFNFDVLEK